MYMVFHESYLGLFCKTVVFQLRGSNTVFWSYRNRLVFLAENYMNKEETKFD